MKALKPKYKVSDSVKFTINNESNTGTIVVVDKGVFEDPYNVYYDIEGFIPGTNELCWYKHIPETNIELI